MATQDIFTKLHGDHERIEGLLEKLCETGTDDKAQRQKLFGQLKDLLLTHSKAEEQTFYKRLERSEETHEEALEGGEEHHIVENLLREMDESDCTSDKWTAKLKVLKELVCHHIEEEEDEIFDDAHEVLSDKEAQEIGKRFEEKKKSLKPPF